MFKSIFNLFKKKEGETVGEVTKKVINTVVPSVPSTSPSLSINKVDLLKAVRTALIAGAAVALEKFAEHLTATDFGTYTPYVVLAVTGLVDLFHRYVKDN